MPNLIMPKQTGKRSRFEASLKIYYNHKDEEWVNNDVFKTEIVDMVPEIQATKQDAAMVVKQSEICRYFGLVERPANNLGAHRARITPRGIKFYEALLRNDLQEQTDLIFQSLTEDSFGRNNSAVPSCDSVIDPPVVFLKAIHKLTYLTKDEFAYILFQLHDNGLDFDDVIAEIVRMRNIDAKFNIPKEQKNKYGDIKFVVFFKDLETRIIYEDDHKYHLESAIEDYYGELIEQLSVRNDITANTKIDFTHRDIERITNPEVRAVLEAEQERRETTYAKAYDDLVELTAQNNRSPEIVDVARGRKYKTNARIRKTALKLADYKCECADEHWTFLNSQNRPYTEAHYLIPMEMQSKFGDQNLDRTENIVSLCSTCHNQIHYGNPDAQKAILMKLFDMRKEKLAECGIVITAEDIKSFYGIK